MIHKVLFFDGQCGLCNRWVDIVLKLDRSHIIMFSPLQSNYAKKTLGALAENTTTIVYQSGLNILTESDAIIQGLSDIGGYLRIIRLAKVIPKFMRNALYRQLSKNRYLLFKKQSMCRIPSEIEKHRFILD